MSHQRSLRRKKQLSVGKKVTLPNDGIIASDNIDERLNNSTTGGISSPARRSLGQDATDAPKIGEKEEVNEPYAQTTAALVDKHVFSKKSISFILLIGIFIISGYIFVQDNGAGKLNSWKDIWWSVQKCSFFFLLFVLFLIFQFFAWIFKRSK